MTTNYEKMLKAINEATALRGVIDSVRETLNGISSQIEGNKREIAKRVSLEDANKDLELKQAEVAKNLEQHEAEMAKRLAELEKNGVKLPIANTPKPFVYS